MVDSNTVVFIRDIDPLIAGRGAGLVARAWEAVAGLHGRGVGLRVSAWVSLGIPRAKVEQAAQAGVLRRLAAGGSR